MLIDQEQFSVFSGVLSLHTDLVLAFRRFGGCWGSSLSLLFPGGRSLFGLLDGGAGSSGAIEIGSDEAAFEAAAGIWCSVSASLISDVNFECTSLRGVNGINSAAERSVDRCSKLLFRLSRLERV